MSNLIPKKDVITCHTDFNRDNKDESRIVIVTLFAIQKGIITMSVSVVELKVSEIKFMR